MLYGAPATLSTTDSKVFTFGTDSNGYATTPMGKVGIYPSLSAVPDSPWREGFDYLSEGSQIRLPNDRTYSGTLYWRGITPPADLDATHNPTLLPEASRILIPHIAVLNFAKAGARNGALVDEMASYLGEPWAMNKGAFSRWCVVWRTQFKRGGALGASYTGRQIAILSQL